MLLSAVRIMHQCKLKSLEWFYSNDFPYLEMKTVPSFFFLLFFNVSIVDCGNSTFPAKRGNAVVPQSHRSGELSRSPAGTSQVNAH